MSLSRRQLLQMALLLSLGSRMGGVHAAGRPQRVLVLGAGMAGLAAARTLVSQGHAVTLLEARERIGGRIWTSTVWPDVPVDMGASWIHGTQGNPLVSLARQAGARTQATRYASTTSYTPRLGKFTPAIENDLEAWREVIEQALHNVSTQGPDVAVRTVVERAVGWDKLDEDDRAYINYLLNDHFEQEFAGSAEELSARHFDSEGFDGDDVLFPQGYSQLTDWLARGLTVRLGTVVQSVEQDEREVRVQTSQGRWVADHVIVTLPLGVLQSGQVQFSPPLPQAKQTAIRSLGMGVLNKCYLRFPKVFWPNTDWLTVMPDVAHRGQWQEWINLHRIARQPVLLGFNAVEFGRAIEGWSDRDVVHSAMQTLRSVFGTQIPEPSRWQLTRWGQDPYARGAYSFNKLGSTPEMRDQLAASSGRLHFAGEATHRDYFATVHGAWLSGVQAARRLQAAA
ncbi:flavin monoamine oxidase family protein [Leeia sp.]|uniref:flavin monoamine oxidase family protein n=1 Tax=Leeia sp. TaxID=2884678 RepID=UPI0035AF4195